MHSTADTQVFDYHQVVASTIAMATLADRREWTALEELFTPQIVADYTAMNGGEATPVQPSELVAGWKQALETFVSTQHIVSNHEVKLHGDRDEVTAYFQATHCKQDGTLWVLGGEYYYELERKDERWLIVHIVMTPTWSWEANNTLALR